MGLLPILAVPFVTLSFLLAQRRLGPEGARLIGALPSRLPLILIGTALVAGDEAAGTLAVSTTAHVPIQVAFAVVFARETVAALDARVAGVRVASPGGWAQMALDVLADRLPLAAAARPNPPQLHRRRGSTVAGKLASSSGSLGG